MSVNMLLLDVKEVLYLSLHSDNRGEFGKVVVMYAQVQSEM